MSFLCLCFAVRIDLLDVNGDVGDLDEDDELSVFYLKVFVFPLNIKL